MAMKTVLDHDGTVTYHYGVCEACGANVSQPGAMTIHTRWHKHLAHGLRVAGASFKIQVEEGQSGDSAQVR